MATLAGNGNVNGQRDVVLPEEIEISDQTRLDVRRMWASVYRNRWPMIAVVVLSLIIGLLVTIFTTPIYEASATIQIEPRANQSVKSNTEVEPELVGSYDAQRYVSNAVDVIRSRAVAEKVAEDLKLYTSNTFFEAMNLQEPNAQPGQSVDQSLLIG